MNTRILYVDSRLEFREEIRRALEPLKPQLQFACTREEAWQTLSTAKAEHRLPHIVFLAWSNGLTAEALRTIKTDFTLRGVPVIVLAPQTAGNDEINSIYDLYANAVVVGDDLSQVNGDLLRRIGEFWILIAAKRQS